MSVDGRPRGRPAIAAAFEHAAGEGRAALIPYLTAGFPGPDSTIALLEAAARGGADIIELGIPFSDPIADGPTIQHSSQVALANGFRVADGLEALRVFRARWATPVIVFSYLNPLLALSGEMSETLASAGVDGALLVDLSFEDGGTVREALASADLAFVPLLAPTTSEPRMAAIAECGSGFLYVVSMTGVTGQHLTTFESVRSRVTGLRAVSKLPVAVGFGVRTPEDVAAIAAFADGVVVGSEAVRRIGKAGSRAAPKSLERYVRQLREGTFQSSG